MVTVETRYVTGVALLLFLPVAYYLVNTGRDVVALSLVSVGLVVASLYLMLGPTNEESVAPE